MPIEVADAPSATKTVAKPSVKNREAKSTALRDAVPGRRDARVALLPATRAQRIAERIARRRSDYMVVIPDRSRDTDVPPRRLVGGRGPLRHGRAACFDDIRGTAMKTASATHELLSDE